MSGNAVFRFKGRETDAGAGQTLKVQAAHGQSQQRGMICRSRTN
jgi:hypothetical protein